MSEFFTQAWVRLSNALYREQGQATTEYVMIVAAIVLVVGAIIGTSTTGLLGKIVTKATSINL